jgi:aspartyl/glutamyl-tRNA(Asn/Gln) amidotransferase C subunit
MNRRRIDAETVRSVARLAGIRLDEAEAERCRAELSQILDAFRMLDELDTGGIEPDAHRLEGLLREDEPRPCPPSPSLHLDQGFFRVHRGNG